MALSGAACARRADLGAIGDGPSSLLWKATFEAGNLSEWVGDGQGGTLVENAGGTPTVTSTIAHGGTMAVTLGVTPMASMTSEMYLFRNQPSPDQAYYSAWFYVPSPVGVVSYLSLFHFRASHTSDGQNPFARWDVNLYTQLDGTLAAQLYDYVQPYNLQQVVPVRFPTDEWVQLEVLFAKAAGPTGRVAVWQNGTLILDRSNVATLPNDWMQWDAGGASDNLTPPTATVYLDDAAISLVRLGPDARL